MSNKVQPPKKVMPESFNLSNEPDDLVREYRKINAQIVNSTSKIKQHQSTIQASQQAIQQIEKQGLQLVGQSQMLTRILNGMGVDPQEYSLPEDDKKGENSPAEAKNGAEVVDIKEDKAKKAPPNRFRKS